MKFEEILNHHNNNIYTGGWEKITPVVWSGANRNLIILNKNGKDVTITVNDLLSPESGFLQACKWNNKNTIPDTYKGIDIGFERGYEDREFHAMILSILSQEEKIKYIEDNVIVE